MGLARVRYRGPQQQAASSEPKTMAHKQQQRIKHKLATHAGGRRVTPVATCCAGRANGKPGKVNAPSRARAPNGPAQARAPYTRPGVF